MDNTTWTNATPIQPDELPPGLTTYLAAHLARDLDTATTFFDENSSVTDEGQTHVGPAAIRAWMSTAASEYTYTTALTGVGKLDDAHYDVLHRLEGDFPGGVADLHFRFTLRGDTRAGDAIASLVIEP